MIGFFDSGLGGVSVLQAARARLPAHDFVYLADSAYCPYGPRSVAEIRERSLICAFWLIAQGAEMIVVACNTATSAAVEFLRGRLNVPVVGMEPGVKPAVAATRNRQIGVLATESTLASERFAQLVDRFAQGMTVHTVPAPALVKLVEQGIFAGPVAQATVAQYLAPLRAAHADVIVLGCTHFPFLGSIIAAQAGPEVTIIDTGPAVAARVAELAEEHAIHGRGGSTRYATTGDPLEVGRVLRQIIGHEISVIHA